MLASTGAFFGGHMFQVGAQERFPTKPLRMVVPLPAGGTIDAIGRIYADKLQVALNQPVVVDNKPGGQYVIGVQSALSSPADGHTVLYFDIGLLASQTLLKRFNILKQFSPVCQTSYFRNVLLASTHAPFSTIKEMIEWGRSNPKSINYASHGSGSLLHLLGHAVTKACGIEAFNIPFKGGPDALIALLQGEVHLMVATSQLGKLYVEKGQLKVLAVFPDKRLPLFPSAPTFKELGLDVPNLRYWSGFAVPSGTPVTAAELLRRQIVEVSADPALRTKMEENGSIMAPSSSSAEFSAQIEHDLNWIAATAKSMNLNAG